MIYSTSQILKNSLNVTKYFLIEITNISSQIQVISSLSLFHKLTYYISYHIGTLKNPQKALQNPLSDQIHR